MSASRPISDDGSRGAAYDARFARLAAAGHDVHGEASFVEALGVRSVLDAGCGTGRVAIELARRGLEVVGVDLDPEMLAAGRAKAPDLPFIQADLATLDLGRRFEAAVMAGNVMIFVRSGTEPAVVTSLASHLEPGGLLVAGFQLHPGGFDLPSYDACCAAAGLDLAERYATWERQPWRPGGDYAVSVHRRSE